MEGFIILIKNPDTGHEYKYLDFVSGQPRVFDTGQEAAAICKSLNEQYRERGKPQRGRVVKLGAEKPVEIDWRQRETERFAHGKYRRPVWHDTYWYRDNCYGSANIADHFLHVAQDDPTQVAFTPDEAAGVADKQTRLSPEAYLKRFFGNHLSDTQIEEWGNNHIDAFGPDLELLFATTPEEIEKVYTSGKADANGQHYPPSCMSYSAFRFRENNGCPVHPVRVYGAGDLAVAYIKAHNDDNKVVARAVCWPEKQQFGRLFGREKRLYKAFRKLGWSEADTFRGARLLRMVHPEDEYALVCPYIDNGSHVIDDGKHLIINGESRHGTRHDCHRTDGLTTEPHNNTECESCGRYVNEDDITYADGSNICSDCLSEHYFCCHSCGDYSHNDNAHEHSRSGNYYCRTCFDDRFFNCASCDQTHRLDYAHTTEEGETLCDECYHEAYFHCEECSSECNRSNDYNEINGHPLCNDCYTVAQEAETTLNDMAASA